ncbi:LacI family DNA-binding transcriptional regulator [Convivina praedatoris]|uniref:HTH-type transcriptional repressor CytR n=1 Tax=Convivina praedatoris TaxID=2880963 RepID=A0ABM9D1A7_9LACO|nr:LacI family DNA-binding transcriptional regulator [Convivina sp. LMG 32447]CAH1851730.1 HTH-type transcriptional repressor CytR [Convivina sp. LMG 32447]CAH1853803.1 HTH-type transcriptional repressor CytR [Convivina sp. LMG 32447]CAH1854271.1 HTH-type transcriptional repressor CytR [Convivina sp. LMG 32447]
MTITIKDIANRAGLSAASVSRILTNRGRFSEKTAQHVRQLADEMGYYKNQSAADLSQKESRVIGVLVPITHTNFADEIIKGMQGKATELGYELLIAFIASDNQQQLKTIKSLLSRQLLAVVMLAIEIKDNTFKVLENADILLLSVSNQLNNVMPSISSDNYSMMFTIVDYLYQKGHRQIALIGASDQHSTVANLRRQGFIDALLKHKINYNPDFIYGDENAYQTGLNAIQKFGKPLPFTAVIGSADIISIGLLNGAKDAGIKVPDDLSIITIDGTELTELTRPILTAAQQNFAKMGELAITTLAGQKLSPDTVVFTNITLKQGGTVAQLD